MPYDDQLATRVRAVLARRTDVEEKAMFGGLAFMVRGHMACGLVGDTLMVRIAPADYITLLDEPHARPMDFTGRPMKGFLYVDPAGLETPSALRRWTDRATTFVSGLPDKTAKPKRARRHPPPRGERR
jgi:TfoX/Sxy family transcriptional regulator of competence genes